MKFNKQIIAIFFFLGVALLSSFDTKASNPEVIFSPNGNIEFQVFSEEGYLMYSVAFNGTPVIEQSPLGMTVSGQDLGNGVQIGSAETVVIDETYPWRGKHATAVNHYRGIELPVTHTESGTQYRLDVRVFNDGVAFRYVIPGSGDRTVSQETTSFTIPNGGTVWYHGLASMHYEEQHAKSEVSQVKKGEWAGPPMTVKLPNGLGYAAITESGIIRSSRESFPGMALQADGNRVFRARLGHEHPANYPYVLRYGEEDHERLTEAPEFHGTIESPWRVVIIGSDLNTLFNSDIVHNVAPKPDPELFPDGVKTEWLKPGRAVWGYLTDEPRTLEGMKNLSRLAGELGFEHHTVEGHWRNWSIEEQKEFVNYSNEQGVEIHYWKHSRDLRDPEAREEFFNHLKEVGVAGAKIDFFDHEAKEIIDLYAACLREAAERELVLNFHGANKPAGEVRTWPNEMTREGIYGMEFRGPWAKHNTTTPFTRLLAGHVDYTPVALGERRAETSETHQLASALVLQAPLLNFAEHPQTLLNHDAVEYIKQIPTVWDETIVLPASEIGKVAAFARRNGDKWFISVMNGEEERNIQIDLSFLEEEEYDDDYNLMMIRDKMPESAMTLLVRERESFGVQKGVLVDNTMVNSDESLVIELIPGGGFVGVISRQ